MAREAAKGGKVKSDVPWRHPPHLRPRQHQGHFVNEEELTHAIPLRNGDLVRRDELLARYGGEEFAVVLPETTIESAALFAERIRAEVETATFDYDEEPLQITISLGATTLEPSGTQDTLVARADANQYKTKEEGRNRVVAVGLG
ncbi:MAG: hypothetical protein QOC81_386 [Thermoanaerobaculia bacterium]|jgi:diguanylate cyclase (GGDEF)-like protein|nr:hypothetical protein [Thermoanaerobaculia bacterium]